ncbi:nucleoside-diphosphate sugar epimerase [Catellatospora sp. IY07-71]|uniref:NAD-dependent epimerase/dehydratase family protein n=1 Tax=Catellatospora sp. IY07-71 TaxID=2728827 RepID=UPI001BB45857|nr:NAD-dependent epimerase/dehydratase family protein [Catellatospora sp. IY07-71]BCJ74361.1 nucleoside-diphosphate sugar epimerase [Catellatospora sp. IY07-71]
MRVVVVGATGNIGTAVLRRLLDGEEFDQVTGVARRLPREDAGPPYDRVQWHALDVGAPGATAELTSLFAGAAAVVHLAWQIQPSHDRARIRQTNITGTANVAAATVAASVPMLLAASSVGAYAPGPKDDRVDEDWPVTGVPGSTYSEDKAEVEALLDVLEQEHPQLRVVRVRNGLAFQRCAAAEIARLFIGPLAPLSLLRHGRIPLLPGGKSLRVQAVHTDDVAEAYARAILAQAHGAFNIAADPVLDAASVGARFHGVAVPTPPALLHAAAALTWTARLQPTEPGWIRLAANCPLMSCRRAEVELGWRPRTDALDAFTELIEGMADGTGDGSPPLRSRPSATARLLAMAGGRLPGHGDPY